MAKAYPEKWDFRNIRDVLLKYGARSFSTLAEDPDDVPVVGS
jgi:hypothetical protein